MPAPAQQSSLAGSFRLFQLWGISVYVHWSWALVAYLVLQYRTNLYDSQVWNVVEYLTLFVIVLLHEFGHALACRQVGGIANEIVLWPLGGIAFVMPPVRPGAWLWSIAAGPLVNVVLVPVTIVLYRVAVSNGWTETNADLEQFLSTLVLMNLALLIFNMLPVYPLDGGQILQALLWFVIGRSTSLLVVSVIGMVASAAAIAFAVSSRDVWMGVLAAFIALRSWAGFQQARFLARMADAPRHQDAACPNCEFQPLVGEFWGCGRCGTRFDTFTHRGVCPGCGQRYEQTACPECLKSHPIEEWFAAGSAVQNRREFD
jgi:Zn-dependent protease